MAWMNSATPNLAWHYSPMSFTPKWYKKNNVGWNTFFYGKLVFYAKSGVH